LLLTHLLTNRSSSLSTLAILLQLTVAHALFLGVLQGLTEFLPISSSGHLALAEEFLRLPLSQQDLQGFDILLHAATALALLLCYVRLWWKLGTSPFTGDKESVRLLAFVIVATIPAAVAGVLWEDWIVEHTRSIDAVAITFILTGIALVAAHFAKGSGSVRTLSWKQTIIVGLAQALALLPGLSRSGLTVSAAQLSGMERREALDFSFIIAFPIILGASLHTGIGVLSGTVVLPPLPVSMIGFLTSFFVSVFAIFSLRRFVARFSLAWFALYLLPVGFLLLFAR
jgi:undecaprenyl-diphosphatase